MSGHVFGPGEYRTRDGRRAFVVHQLLNGAGQPYRLVGYIPNSQGWHCVQTWEPSGQYLEIDETAADLLPPPPPRMEWWSNVYSNGYISSAHNTKNGADHANNMCSKRAGLLRLTLEGEPGNERVVSADVEPQS